MVMMDTSLPKSDPPPTPPVTFYENSTKTLPKLHATRYNKKIFNLFYHINYNSSKSLCSRKCTSSNQRKYCTRQHTWTLNQYFQQYPHRMKEYPSEVQNIFCLKSQIKGHRNGQLGSLADTAQISPVQLSCPAGCFHGH